MACQARATHTMSADAKPDIRSTAPVSTATHGAGSSMTTSKSVADSCWARNVSTSQVCTTAAACASSLDSRVHEALAGFAAPIGLAFQIQDDLLDVLGDVTTLGKATGADSERSKPTHPAIIGIEASQERVRLLHAQALESLAPLGARAELLRSLADWLLARHY